MSVTRAESPWARSSTVVGAVLVMLAIAVGHVLLIADFTTFYLGVPLWLWLHLGVVVVLLAMAWVVVERLLAGGA